MQYIYVKKISLTSWVYLYKVSFSRLNVNLQTREGVKSAFVKGGKLCNTSFLQRQNARFGHVRNTRVNSESKSQAAYTDLKIMSLAWSNALLENCFAHFLPAGRRLSFLELLLWREQSSFFNVAWKVRRTFATSARLHAVNAALNATFT